MRPAPAEPASGSGLYSAEEALRDVLSGELRYIGTGRWPGVERSRACAFRNDRVFVVNAYCSPKEPPAFGVEVFSPERGRVRIYAEARGPVSRRDRAEYFTFLAESEPPPGPEVPIAPVLLSMSYDELSRYERQRYAAFLPGCHGGESLEQPTGGCLGPLASRAEQWAAENHSFLASPNDDWYRTLRMLRSLALRYGRAPD